MRGRERARGQFITQHRLQSGLARSLEVKDIPWKNVNRDNATRANHPHHGAGAGPIKGPDEEGEATTTKKKKDSKGHNLILEEHIKRGQEGEGELQGEEIWSKRIGDR